MGAAGVDIRVRSDRGSRFVTGTCIAPPVVTGRLAAERERANTREVSAVRERLAATAAELGPVGHDPTYGYGLATAAGLCD